MKNKLIEVALPLDKINAAAAKEKNIRHGHPSTLHLWWARRPLAACRAVLFASMVDDPSSNPARFPTDEAQQMERDRLFAILEKLVVWENSENDEVLDEARREILAATGDTPPRVHDPFCGGGSIPLEAQRLGLNAGGSDLNPVAVLVTKALIEIPVAFMDQPPVNPEAQRRRDMGTWRSARGLAEDVRFYGQWMREQAWARIGHLYPTMRLPAEHGGGDGTIIAWLWARTVRCPNPACGGRMPLIRSFALSTKKDKEAWLEPTVDRASFSVSFKVNYGAGPVPEGTKQRNKSRCMFCEQLFTDDTIRQQSRKHGIESIPLAVVVDTPAGRAYFSADSTSFPEFRQQLTSLTEIC